MDPAKRAIRLGVNIDHVATLRNARGGEHPCPVRAAQALQEAGHTDLITVHLREDRRHINDKDVAVLKRELSLPLNLEMAVTKEMLAIARETKPEWVCLVPERRQEVTTEGGLAIEPIKHELKDFIARLQGTGIKVSLFVDPNEDTIDHAKDCGADAVELHTGSYAHDPGEAEIQRLTRAALKCEALNLNCHAGHGLTFANVQNVARILPVTELNIGHFLIGEALFVTLPEAVQRMKKLMIEARSGIRMAQTGT